ncbi:MAG TPA: 2-amino-4-hydroxy-6-hydroxymethyldihydropteridine diphosphokinase [Methylovirgula sp.]|jgi:2-amino-4-hydroxy-6-hydroxymethyldihydropteridine diphosphokinase
MPSNAPENAHAIEIGLGLGSNIGDKPANIRNALALLEKRGVVHLKAVSSIYRTPPWGYLEQENFANACALATTTLAPEALLHGVKEIEADMGRQETVRWGPRLIDIDILFYGSEPLTTPDLVLPHKELFNRAFVLVPLAEIAPHLVLAGQSIAEAAARSREPIEKWRDGD